ncbi:RUS family member 1 [Ischnura elegans]|uniref:RUS family member 1 n=1 Tax=Ischnura elegans TaxID=197161 RepID=UPI001ED87EA7|nr:RUS family member 1 [Ischnura elegans]
MQHQVVFKEKYGPNGVEIAYVKPPDQENIVKVTSGTNIHKTIFESIACFFRQIFLPHGYPVSVSEDYFDYQKWDTIQAFCSTITGTLTTRAIMEGVGVGDNAATPLAAAITWILKDGTGMIGRILFAWWKSTSLDSNCKQWRLVADILNDAAMTIELMVPYVPGYVTQVLCVSTTLKAIVGVSGGATRAAITQHQSIRNNMADVSAKDGSQETLVNLFASIMGVFLLSHIGSTHLEWKFFVLLTFMHLYANYRAVKSIKFKTLNVPRFLILLETYLTRGRILSPEVVNAQESAFLGRGISDKSLCGFKIKVGQSISSASSSLKSKSDLLKLVTNIQKQRPYLLIVDGRKRCIHVILRQDETPQDVIKAYFHAVQLGISTCLASKEPLEILKIKSINSPLARLKESMNIYMQGMSSTNTSLPPLGKCHSLPVEAMLSVDELVDADLDHFMGGIESRGWVTANHQLIVDEWRGLW